MPTCRENWRRRKARAKRNDVRQRSRAIKRAMASVWLGFERSDMTIRPGTAIAGADGLWRVPRRSFPIVTLRCKDGFTKLPDGTMRRYSRYKRIGIQMVE